jgi:hypothetical protein
MCGLDYLIFIFHLFCSIRYLQNTIPQLLVSAIKVGCKHLISPRAMWLVQGWEWKPNRIREKSYPGIASTEIHTLHEGLKQAT